MKKSHAAKGDPYSLAAFATSFGRPASVSKVSKEATEVANAAGRAPQIADAQFKVPERTERPRSPARPAAADTVKKPSFGHTSSVTLRGHERAVCALSLDGSGARMLSGSYDFHCRFWDFNGMDRNYRAYQARELLEGHQVRALEWSGSGDAFLAALNHVQLRLYGRDGLVRAESAKGDPYIRDLRSTKGHTAGVTVARWHPSDATRLLSGSTDATIRIWDAARLAAGSSQVIVCRSQGQSRLAQVSSAAWGGPQWVWGATRDGYIRGWDTRKSMVRADADRKDAHAAGSAIGGLAVLARDPGAGPQDALLVTRAMDDTLKAWDARKMREPVAEIRGLNTLFDETNVAVSPDARFVVTGVSADKGAKNGAVAVIDTQSWREVHRIELTGGSAICAAWHPKLDQLFVGCSSGEIAAFYAPGRSVKGVLHGLAKEFKKANIEDVRSDAYDQMVVLDEHNEHINRGAKAAQARNKRVAVATKPPTMAVTGLAKGAGGQVGSNTVQHLMKEFVGDPDGRRFEDPREALLKYAGYTEAKYVTGYEKSQPKRIFDERFLEDEEAAAEEEKYGGGSIVARQLAKAKKKPRFGVAASSSRDD